MKAVVFDLDGTLIDSMDMWENLQKTFVEDKNLILTDEVSQTMATMSLNLSSAYLKEYYNLKDSAQDIYNYFKKIIINYYINEAKPKEDAFETVEAYNDLGYDVVLGTATNYEFIEPLLDRFDLKRHFKFVQTVHSIKTNKDNSKFFKLISDKLEVVPDKIFLFDDARFALNAAKDIGIKTVAVYDKYSEKFWNEIKTENDYAIKTFKDWDVK
ncbi:HAD family hydrolase [Anaerosphaera multitolerans]|uniref:HAD family phosphatase n=1 Tax=Anaerosphaera multitolerans TaxID=2487351 RepID=A0A437S4U3_9FIRM|nr:HAD family phosphatase [Anaerosphaera multitolerans]RVU54014.1 HAD family phosphatase [Anaerosphaera multitolerans]